MQTKIVFCKTHKTGSTTLQNIFYRFAEENQLLTVLPKNHLNYFDLRNYFTMEQAQLFTTPYIR